MTTKNLTRKENLSVRIGRFCKKDKKGQYRLSIPLILLNTKELLAIILEILDILDELD